MSLFNFAAPTASGNGGGSAPAAAAPLADQSFTFSLPEVRDESQVPKAPPKTLGVDPSRPPQPKGLRGSGGEAEGAASSVSRRAMTPTTTLKSQTAVTSTSKVGGEGRIGRKEATRTQEAPAKKLFEASKAPAAPKPQAPLSSSSSKRSVQKKKPSSAGGVGMGGVPRSAPSKNGESSKAASLEPEDDSDALVAMVLGEADSNDGPQWDNNFMLSLKQVTQVGQMSKETAEEHEALQEQAELQACLVTAHNVELAFATPVDNDIILRSLANFEKLSRELAV